MDEEIRLPQVLSPRPTVLRQHPGPKRRPTPQTWLTSSIRSSNPLCKKTKCDNSNISNSSRSSRLCSSSNPASNRNKRASTLSRQASSSLNRRVSSNPKQRDFNNLSKLDSVKQGLEAQTRLDNHKSRSRFKRPRQGPGLAATHRNRRLTDTKPTWHLFHRIIRHRSQLSSNNNRCNPLNSCNHNILIHSDNRC